MITGKRVVIFLAFLVCMVALEAKTEKEKFELLGCHVELTMPDTTCTYIRRQYNYEEGVLYECIFDNNKGCLIILQGAMMSIMPVDQFIKDSRKTRGCNNGLYWRREIYRNNYGDIRLYYLNVKPEWKFFFDNVLDSVRVYSSEKKDKGIIYTSPSMNHTKAFDLKIFEGDATLHTNLSNFTLYVGKYLEYNGKEFDNLYRLNWLDYGARQYMPDLAQWTSVDPLCEKYYHLSPYLYCRNNPVCRVDPTGLDDIFDIYGNFIRDTGIGSQVFIQTVEGYKTLSSFDYSNTNNISMLIGVSSYYLSKSDNNNFKVNITSAGNGIPNNAVFSNDEGTGRYNIYISDGKINPVLDNKYNLWSMTFHESLHRYDSKTHGGKIGEVRAILSQTEHEAWKGVSSYYRESQANYAAKSLTKEIEINSELNVNSYLEKLNNGFQGNPVFYYDNSTKEIGLIKNLPEIEVVIKGH